MAEYNPNVIRKFADRLCPRAATIVITCTFVGVLVGGGLGSERLGTP